MTRSILIIPYRRANSLLTRVGEEVTAQLGPRSDRLDQVVVSSLDLNVMANENVNGPEPDGSPQGRKITQVIDLVLAADVIAIVTPIYNASYPGSIKVLLDALPVGALTNSRVVLIGTVGHPRHSMALDYALQPVLQALGALHVVRPMVVSRSEWDRGEGRSVLRPDTVDRIARRLDEAGTRELNPAPEDETDPMVQAASGPMASSLRPSGPVASVPRGLVLIGGEVMDPGALDLVVVPHAGGSAHAFQGWTEHIKSLGGRLLSNRSSFNLTSPKEREIEARAQALARALAELGRPYALLGHSMGALVALTATRILEADDPAHVPVVTVACAIDPPHRFSLDQDLSSEPEDLVKFLRRMGGTTEEVLADPGLRELALEMLAGDLDALRAFTWDSVSLETPLLVMLGREDGMLREELIPRWEDIAALVDLRWFPGGHFFLHEHVPQMLAAIQGWSRSMSGNPMPTSSTNVEELTS